MLIERFVGAGGEPAHPSRPEEQLAQLVQVEGALIVITAREALLNGLGQGHVRCAQSLNVVDGEVDDARAHRRLDRRLGGLLMQEVVRGVRRSPVPPATGAEVDGEVVPLPRPQARILGFGHTGGRTPGQRDAGLDEDGHDQADILRVQPCVFPPCGIRFADQAHQQRPHARIRAGQDDVLARALDDESVGINAHDGKARDPDRLVPRTQVLEQGATDLLHPEQRPPLGIAQLLVEIPQAGQAPQRSQDADLAIELHVGAELSLRAPLTEQAGGGEEHRRDPPDRAIAGQPLLALMLGDPNRRRQSVGDAVGRGSAPTCARCGPRAHVRSPLIR